MRQLIATLTLGIAMIPGLAMAQDKITLNWALWDWKAVAYQAPLVEAYEKKNPNVTIEHTDLGSPNYLQMLMTQLTGGSSEIDIVSIKDVPTYAQLVGTNSLVDLTKVWPEPIDPAPYKGLIEALTVDGALYGMPIRSDFWVVYYNKKLFDDAGVGYPTNDMTTEQYDELAKKMTTGFGQSKVYGSHLHTWRFTATFPAILDGKHTLIEEDYSFLKPYYERALALQEEGVVQPYAALKASNTHYSAAFFNGHVAMMPMGTWFIGTQIAKVKSGESLATDWGIVSLPHPEGVAAGTTAAAVTSLGINRNSTKQDAALDFIRFAAGPEGRAILAATATLPAVRDDAVIQKIASLDGFPKDEASREALKTGTTYLELPVNTQAAQIEVVLNRAHDEIMTDNISIDGGLAEMSKGVSEILKR